MRLINIFLFILILFCISCGANNEKSEDGSKETEKVSSSKSKKEEDRPSVKGQQKQKIAEKRTWDERIDKLKEAWDQAGGEGTGSALTESMRDSAAYFEALKKKIKESQERLREKEERRTAKNDPERQARREKSRLKHSLRLDKYITKDILLETVLANYDSLWVYMKQPEKFSDIFDAKIEEKMEELDVARINADMLSMTEQVMLESAELSLKNTPSLSQAEVVINQAKAVNVEQMLEEGKVSDDFVKKYNYKLKSATRLLNRRKKLAKAAKAEFKQLNPDLYFGEDLEDTYFDKKNNAVYLPMGKLSFADQVVDFYHPKGKTNQSDLLGEPNDRLITKSKGTYSSSDNIYSLGLSGEVIIQFTNNALVDVNGPDLYIFEVGATEPTQLSISKDGKKWIEVGKIEGGTAQVDIAEFIPKGELYYFVKLKDLDTFSRIPGADVDAIAAIGSAIRLQLDSKVLFDTGKSQLKREGVTAVKRLVENIQVLDEGRIIVEGHTDDIGSEKSNKSLSMARAISVSKELQKHISKKKFSFKEVGHGENQPKVENNSDENRAKNRRVEILIIPN